MNISAATWQHLSKLLDEALDLEPAARATWLERLSSTQPELEPSVRKLLAAHASSETADLLARLPGLPGTARRLSSLEPGDLIGPYRLEREVGSGGMADVWLAERADGAFTREVALKLPMISRLRRDLAQRFARERDILARLEHPHIARLYDAGVSDDGLPYLAMEYVDGQPITEYCDRHRLTIDARLKLFMQVLGAVQYAHANLIIHRDLKPSNILVTADGQVRLLDFGIAKLLAGDAAASETQLTQLSGRALTPDYASPEQVKGEPLTIATDVYSLGVVLYELLAGRRPYRLKASSAAQLEAAIVDAEAVAPGAGLTAEAAAARGSTPKRLARTLSGDLDVIALKALEKAPGNRYLTVAEFADDLSRFGSGRTIRAQSPSWSYRARKFLVRNRIAVIAGGASAAALMAGAAAALWQADVARRQAAVAREQAALANKESQRATAVQDFLLDIFRANTERQGDPIKARSVTAREMLDVGAARLESALEESPEAQAEVMKTLADMYLQLQLDEEAARIGQRRIDVLRKAHGNDDPRVAQALIFQAMALSTSGRRSEILPALQEAERILDAAGDRDSALRGSLMIGFARRYQALSLEKMKFYADEAVRIFRPQKLPVDLSVSLQMAARARARMGEHSQAVPLFREAIAELTNSSPISYLSLVQARNMFGDTLVARQEFGEAISQYRASVAEGKAQLGESDLSGLFGQTKLAAALHQVGERAEARRLHEETLHKYLELKGPDDSLYVPAARTDYARSLLAEGRLQHALSLIHAVNESNRRHYQGSPILGGTLRVEAQVLAALGRYDAAQALLDEGWKHWIEGFGSGTPPHQHNGWYLDRAHLSLMREELDEVLKWLDRLAERPGDEALPLAVDAVQRDLLRSEVHLRRGQTEPALALATQAFEMVAKSPFGAYFGALDSQAALQVARTLLAVQRPEAAQPYVARALNWRRTQDAEISPWLAEAEVADGQLLLAQGKTQMARAAAHRAAAIHAAQPAVAPHHAKPLDRLRKSLSASSSQPATP